VAEKQNKRQDAPAFMLVFVGIMAGFLIVALIWGFYEHTADRRYYGCMLEFASDYCNDSLDSFDPTHSAVLCKQKGLSVWIPQAITPYILDNITVGICWNRSRSLMHQIGG